MFQALRTEHEKREWRRVAIAAYAEDRNDEGHRYSAYGALRIGESIPLNVFDTLQANYRAQLIAGFDQPTLA